jgi:hypothetical protein
MSMVMADMVWHYTGSSSIQMIVESGFIRLARKGFPTNLNADGSIHYAPPLVWFSTNQYLERSIFPHRGDNLQGIWRIGVAPETAPIRFTETKVFTELDAEVRREGWDAALGAGCDPREWRCSTRLVPREKWLAVEIFSNGAWSTVAARAAA